MLATTRGALLRGTTVDEFGEPIDSDSETIETWSEQRRNFARDPVPTSLSSAYSLVAFTGAPRSDFPDSGDGIVDCLRFTRSSSSAARISTIIGATMPTAQPVAVRMRIRSSVSVANVAVIVRAAIATTSGQNTIGTVTIPAGTSELIIVGTASATASASAGLALLFPADAGHVGQTVDITAWQFEAGEEVEGFFYGDTPDTAEWRFSWVGTPPLAPSIAESVSTTVEDGAVVGADDFALSITEVSRDVFDPADNTLRTVRKLIGRIPANITVQEGDRLRDNRTGEIFIIDEDERTPRSISGRASVTLSLRRTGG